jgi:hypothetical protein
MDMQGLLSGWQLKTMMDGSHYYAKQAHDHEVALTGCDTSEWYIRLTRSGEDFAVYSFICASLEDALSIGNQIVETISKAMKEG